MTKKIVVIGAGIAGLSAGVHARRNGYEVEIYEKHSLPGGLCTAWERNGYTFDGCIHWLVGSRSGSQFNKLWSEVCAIERMDFYHRDIFMTVEGEGDHSIKLYTDLDRLKEHLLEKAPEDTAVITKIIEGARALSKAAFPLEKPEELYRFWDMPAMLFKMLPIMKIMGLFSRVSIHEYLEQLQNPFLKEALGAMMPTGYPMISLISTLASLHDRDAGFPAGGSLKFARALEDRFQERGGAVNYRSAVKEIVVEDGRAAGLLLKDGTRVDADMIISSADMHHTLYDMLGGRYLTPLIKDSFRNLPLYSSVQVSLGINADLTGETKNVTMKLAGPIILGGECNRYLYLTNYAFDPALSPPGKSVVTATLYSSFEHWQQSVAKDRDRYRRKKEDLAKEVIAEVENRFPMMQGKVEVVDVATPFTYHRYTGVHRGAYMSWIVPPELGRFKIPMQLPGLEDFYQIGQWISPPAGLPGSMLTGRHVLQIICSKDGKQFIAEPGAGFAGAS